MAYIQYGHRPAEDKTVPIVNHILQYLTDSKVGILKKIYLEETRFTRHRRLHEYWDNNIIGKEDDKTTGSEIKILIYLLEMLCLEDCQQRRRKELKKIRH
jgi:hypothetical protein